MSDGDKKPGLKDISSLKARLGMLSKAKPTPAAPAPQANVASPFAQPGPVDLSQGGDVELGSDTAIVRIDTPIAQPGAQQAQPAPLVQPTPGMANPFAAPAPRPAAPAPAPGGLGLGENLFSAPAPQPAAAQAAQAGPRSAAQKAADRAAAEALFAAQAQVEAPPEPQVGAEFANPLQRGAYTSAAAPVDLSALEEEALASFEGQQRGMKRSLAITMTVVVALVTMAFGFFIGDVRSARRMVNAQIDASIKVRDLMKAPLSRLGEVEKYIAGMAAKPTQVNWTAVEAIPEDIAGVSPSVVSSPVPLDKDLSGMLGRAVVDLNHLFGLLLTHRRATLVRDKAEIEALTKGEGFFTNKQFAIFATPPADPTKPRPISAGPPRGRVVALMGAPVKNAKDEYIMPVRYRGAADDKNVLLRGITIIPKTDLQTSGTSNVGKLYTKRVEELVLQMKKIKVYETALREKLESEAARQKVTSF